MQVINVGLKGYYGHKNFGDDILFIVAHSIVREALPVAKITVLTHSSDAGYLSQLVSDPDLKVRKPNRKERFDLVVLGGGGVYFDFGAGSVIDELVNLVLKTFVAVIPRCVWNYLRVPQSVHSIALGVGVGTFTSSSSKFRSKISELRLLDRLYVRDEVSLQRSRSLGSKIARRSADLAFAHEYWWASAVWKDTERDIDAMRMLLIVRTWTDDWDCAMRELVPQLEGRFPLTVLVLEPERDGEFLKSLSCSSKELWDPTPEGMERILELFFGAGLVVTQRAHGAIVAAVAGVPSVCLEVEDKLRQVHNMLPRSSQCIGLQDVGELLETISRAYASRGDLRRTVGDDVVGHEARVLDDIREVSTLLRGWW